MEFNTVWWFIPLCAVIFAVIAVADTINKINKNK